MEESLLESCDRLIEHIEGMMAVPCGHNSESQFTNNDNDCNSTCMNASGQLDLQDFEVDAPIVSSTADDQMNQCQKKEDLKDSNSDSRARQVLTSWDVPKTVQSDLEPSLSGESSTSSVVDVNVQWKNKAIEDITRRRDDCKAECSINSRELKEFFTQANGVRMTFTKSPSVCKVDKVCLSVRHRVFGEHNLVRCVMRLIMGSGLYNDLRLHFISPGIARMEGQDLCGIYIPEGLPQGQQISMFQSAALFHTHGLYCENVSLRDSYDYISEEDVQQSTRQENLKISLWSPSQTLYSGICNIITVPNTNPNDITELFSNVLHHVQLQNTSQQTLELWTESSPTTTTEEGFLTELPNDPTRKTQSNIQEYEHLQKSCRLVGPSWEGSLSTDLPAQQFHLIYSFQSSDQQLQWSSIGENPGLPSNDDVRSRRVCKLRRRNAVRFPSASHVIQLRNNRLQESRNCAQSHATHVEVCRNAFSQCLHCKLQEMWDSIVQVQRELLKTWRSNVTLQAELQLQRRKNRQIREARKAAYQSTLCFHSWLQSRPPPHTPR